MKRTIATIVVLLMLVSGATAQEMSLKERNSGAFGLGVPYGILGVNVDIGVAPQLAFSAGLGTTVLAGVGYSIGAKYFLAGQQTSVRPLIGAFYGTNTAVDFGHDRYESYDGLSFMFGVQWMWGARHTSGLDLGVVVIATNGIDSDLMVEEGGKVKAMLGYRRAF